jgi:hypothetical protein
MTLLGELKKRRFILMGLGTDDDIRRNERLIAALEAAEEIVNKQWGGCCCLTGLDVNPPASRRCMHCKTVAKFTAAMSGKEGNDG